MMRFWRRLSSVKTVEPPDLALREAVEAVTNRQVEGGEYVYADYVDEAALKTLADATGVAIDPVQYELERGRSVGVAQTEEVSGVARSPVAEIGVRSSTETSSERSFAETIGTQRRRSMRSIVDQICRMLRAQGVLDEELGYLPASAENEGALIDATRRAAHEWGLLELQREIVREEEEKAQMAIQAAFEGEEDEQADDGETAEGTTLAEAEASALLFDARAVARSLARIGFAAGDFVKGAVLERYEELISAEARTRFALVTLEWGFWDEPPVEPYLWNGHILAADRSGRVLYAPTYLSVKMDKSKITPLAGARYVHRARQSLQVFAKVEGIENRENLEVARIVLTPIVIFSR